MALTRLVPGTVFAGDFVVERALKEGGMGAVYVAVQRSTGARRALKIMRGAFVDNPRARERFFQEARLGAAIGSAHVVEVIGAGIDEATGTPWLAMELLEGQDLDGAVRSHGAMTWPQARELFGQLGDALARAHARGIVHRDLKPENVFVAAPRRPGASFTVKLLDLGIAALVVEGRGAVTATSQIGSPLWMAPEQAAPGARVQPATDVWALGLIAFFALTARPYWLAAQGEGEVLMLLAELLFHPIDAASTRAAALGVPAGVLPPGFDAWFARCVARDAPERYVDATAALGALDAVLSGEVASTAAPAAPPLSATVWAPPPVAAPTQKEPASRWGVALAVSVGIVVVVGVVLVVGAVGLALRPRDVQPAPATPVAAPDDASVARGSVTVCSDRSFRASLAEPRGVVALASGDSHVCARGRDGAVWCWGDNTQGQLGDGTRETRLRPVLATELAGATAIAAGANCTCALRGGVGLRCVGACGRSRRDTAARGAVAAVGVATSAWWRCVWTASGEVWCDDTISGRRSVSFEGATTLAVGGSAVLAARADGSAWWWGDPNAGNLGPGMPVEDSGHPRPLAGLSGLRSISLGGVMGCAVTSNGGVSCWGDPLFGRLGDGRDVPMQTSTPRAPAPVAGLSDVAQVTVGGANVCARTNAGALWCWGYNGHCQSGLGPNVGRATAARVAGIEAVTDVAAGLFFTCAAVASGTVRCWGTNYHGELGNGSTSTTAELEQR